MDIQHLIILIKNNNFQENLVIVSGIYWGLSVRNFIQICLYLTFLLHDDQAVSSFTGHSV